MKKKYKTFWIVGIIAAVLVIGFVVMMSLIFSPKWVVDNAIADSGYKNWRKVELDSNCSFYMPEEWEMSRVSEQMIICDASGETVAIGQKFELNEQGAAQQESFERDVLNCSPLSIATEAASINAFGNDAEIFFRKFSFGDNTTETHLVLRMAYGYDYNYIFVFCDEAESSMQEYAEAIAISYRQK